MLSDDEIHRLFGIRPQGEPQKKEPEKAPEPAGAPHIHLPFPVTLADVNAVYTLAFNYLTTKLHEIGDLQMRAHMAKCALDSIRVAAGVEACINASGHRECGGSDGEEPTWK